MNIYTLRNNLLVTIAGKEKLLAAQCPDNRHTTMYMSDAEKIAREVTIAFLRLNLSELRNILSDAEVCCTQAMEALWTLNPERMGQ